MGAIPGTRKMLEAVIAHAVVTPATALFSNDLPPAGLDSLSAEIAYRWIEDRAVR